MARVFQSLARDDELALLEADTPDFQHTQAYLTPLIEGALALFSFAKSDYLTLRDELRSTVPIAARRFLDNPRNLTATYRFSTYFTWYISQAIDRYFHIRRAA